MPYYRLGFNIVVKLQGKEVTSQLNWEIAKLLEFGVNEKIANQQTKGELRSSKGPNLPQGKRR